MSISIFMDKGKDSLIKSKKKLDNIHNNFEMKNI